MSNKRLNKPSKQTCILVTGGAGYIGSHTCVELMNDGYEVVVVDSLSNSNEKAISRIKEITNNKSKITFYKEDLLNKSAIKSIFKNHDIDAIIHFAGYKAVGESVEKPLEYYINNIDSTLILCECAREAGVKNLIFSSSATVYGDPKEIPITEKCQKGNPTNPYGQTKSMQEQIFRDLYIGDNEWNIVLLRYFNPIGAHESGIIGEDPKGIPNNLVPYISQVAVGKLDSIGVFGDDYDTVDGTGVRDYIHVVDLANGHVAALKWMSGLVGSKNPQSDNFSIYGKSDSDGTRRGVSVFNLGTGKGSSVFEVLHAFEKACGKKLNYQIKPRRSGDIAVCYADCRKAAEELNWVAKYDISRMCEDTWRWQSNNPNGYLD